MFIIRSPGRGGRVAVTCVLMLCAAAGTVAQVDPVTEATVTIDEESDLATLILYAEQNSPTLRAAGHRRNAAFEQVQQARAMPDPTLRVAVGLVPIETRVGPQNAQLSYAQTIPGKGKRKRRGELASAEAEAAAQEYEKERRYLAFRVADAYSELYLLARSIEITRDNRDILIYVEEVVRKAYETGKAPYADLIRSQVEIGSLENDLRSLQDQRRAGEAHLNSLLHRAPDASLPAPRLGDEPLTLRSVEELRSMLKQSSPDLRVLAARIEGESRRVNLAEVEDRPDWRLSLSYLPTGSAVNPSVPDSGRDSVYAGLTVNLPVWRKKHRAASRQAIEQQAAATEAHRQVEDRLGDRLERLLYGFHNSDRELRLYRDTLLPKSEQSLDASQAGLRTGSVGVLELVDATRVLLQFQLGFERAKSERARVLYEMRYLLGGEVLVAHESAGTAEGER